MRPLALLLIAVALAGCGPHVPTAQERFQQLKEEQEKSMREHIKWEQKQFDAQMKAQGHDEYWMDDKGQIRRGKGEGYYPPAK